MLVRSAGRKQQRHTSTILATSFAQLNLPWLAPAQLRWSASQAAAAANLQPSPRPRRRNVSKDLQQARAQIRQLATTTETSPALHETHYVPPSIGSHAFRDPAHDQNIPWDFSRGAKTKYSNLRPRTSPIVLNSTTQSPTAFSRLAAGAHGTTIELLQLLHTTLRVGRISRAEDIIHRLVGHESTKEPEAIHAHTIYLEELLRILGLAGDGTEKSLEVMKHLQRWFEVEVLQKGIQPHEKMLIIMVKAAIRGLSGSQRDRAIRRYVEMAKNLGAREHEEVLYSESYDDNEFTVIGAATSEYNEEAENDHLEEQEQEMDKEVSSKTKPSIFSRQDPIFLEEIPGVRPTEQKGEGLQAVKRSLEAITKLPALPPNAPLEAQRARAYERQRLMEETSVDVALDRWRKEDEDLRKVGISTSMQSKPVGALMFQWYRALMPALEKEKENFKQDLANNTKRDSDRMHYGTYLESLPLRKVAANTILSAMAAISGGKDRTTNTYEYEVKVSRLITSVSNAIEQDSSIEAAKHSQGRKGRSGHTLKSLVARQRRVQKKNQAAGTGKDQPPINHFTAWPVHVKVKLGSMLVAKLVETAQIPVTREHPRTKEKVTQMQPAFMYRARYKLGKKTGMIVPNPTLVAKIESEPLGSLIAKRMPMIVEPKPWTGWKEGGYIHYPSAILRLGNGDKSGQDYFLAAHNQGDMDQLYAGLTALGRIPWKVNHDVLKVQVEAWNTGEAIANFAPLNPEFEIPPEPESTMNPMARRSWLNTVRLLESKRAGLHSKRCFQNFQLEIARSFANETLYFPHNMDFRGRAYPIPPYLNHMGADNARGLLVFANGKELGEEGLRWLKIHLANVAGYDKASLQEREDYTMAHLDDIYDSVKNPLGGRKWWLESEDAWQTLAACHELVKALDSPDPTKFVSHLPIHQDGTCNGLQHYAALGGDEAGAAQVNLEPGDRPADVYTGVLNAVKAEVDKDAAQGNKIALKLQGRLTRKIVKRPVMTNVYGVTFFGARQQVMKEVEEQFPDIKPLDEVNPRNTAHYIASKIFQSLGVMFTGAQAIQHWFGKCADRISTCLTPEQIEQLSSEEPIIPQKKRLSKALKQLSVAEAPPPGSIIEDQLQHKRAKPLFKSTVVWTTPLRLPVVQPYRSSGARVILTNMQRITLQAPQVWDPVSKRKQLQAFPPNFIHSLDATHMLISALKCNEVGMTFASIHDSFWTHACDVNRMSVMLRDAFVAMHSEDIIGRLREEFVTRYQDCMYLASVYAASPVGLKITKLRKERKDMTGGYMSELMMEMERLRLLKSEDPLERQQGENMETPGSVMAAETDESALALPTEMAGQTLGEMPANADVQDAASDADADALSHDGAAEDEDLAHEHASNAGLESAATEEASVLDETGEDLSPSQRLAKAKAQKTARRAKYQRKLYVWMPLTFPEVPKKGTFDVRRLKESKYFFH